MVIQVPVMIFLALLLAVILNQGIRRFRGALRLPSSCPASRRWSSSPCCSGSFFRPTAFSTT